MNLAWHFSVFLLVVQIYVTIIFTQGTCTLDSSGFRKDYPEKKIVSGIAKTRQDPAA